MDNRRTAARVLGVVSVLGFLGVLAYYLPRPGYTHTRLAFFAVLGGLAIVGAFGALRGRPRFTALGTGGLCLLGFWQAVLWVFVYPVVGALVLAAFLDDRAAKG